METHTGFGRMIYVDGGKAKQREAAMDATIFVWNALFPRINRCSIDIHLCNLDDKTGDCLELDDREFEIRIDKNQGFEDFMTCVMHEMIHVKQHIRKEFKDYDFKTYDEYINHPAEKEAYALQEELYKKWKMQ